MVALHNSVGVSPEGEHAFDARWYVVRTQPHAETKAIFHLERQAFRIFCPRIAKTVRHARKTSQVMKPLFPGYIFLSMDAGNARWRSVNGTCGVLNILMLGEMPHPVPLGVVESLMARIGDDGAIAWRPSLRVGQPVRIASGALEDFAGTLEHLDSQGRVRVLLDIMGRGVSVQLHASVLIPG